MGTVTVTKRLHVHGSSAPTTPHLPPTTPVSPPYPPMGPAKPRKVKGTFSRRIRYGRRRVAPMAIKFRRQARKAKRFFAEVDAGLREKNILAEIELLRESNRGEHRPKARRFHRVASAARRLDPAVLAKSARMDILSLEAPDFYSHILRVSRESHVAAQTELAKKKMSQSQLLRFFCIHLTSLIREGHYTDDMRPLVDALMMVARGYCHPTSVPVLLGLPANRGMPRGKMDGWLDRFSHNDSEFTMHMVVVFVGMMCRRRGPAIEAMFESLAWMTFEEEAAMLEMAKRILAGEEVSPW